MKKPASKPNTKPTTKSADKFPDNSADKSILRLTAGVDRPLIHTAGDSVRFLVVELEAPEAQQKLKSPSPAPLNLGLVIDASGSMHGMPIEAAKEAARLLAANLGPDDALSIVSFDTHVQVHVDGLRQDPAGRAVAALAIASIQAGSSTNLSGGWLRGCECVAREMATRPNLRNRVVLLSDGMANVGISQPDELSNHAAELRARGLLSSAVGIGENYSDLQLEAIATSGGGRLHHASNPREIAELVLGELEELRSTVVESCDLVLETPAGFRAELLGDYATTLTSQRLTAVVGSFVAAARRDLVFKLTCPAGNRGDEVDLSISATWRRPGSPQALAVPLEMIGLSYASGARCAAQPRDTQRSMVAATTWQLAIVRAAARLNQDGELHRANDLVTRELDWFRRYCKGLPDATTLVAQLERLAKSIGCERYAPMAAKEMYIRVQKSTRSERDYRFAASANPDWASQLPEE
ncbi:MAG: VWA domain-containing protein [Thermoanaerobaculia bacterium]